MKQTAMPGRVTRRYSDILRMEDDKMVRISGHVEVSLNDGNVVRIDNSRCHNSVVEGDNVFVVEVNRNLKSETWIYRKDPNLYPAVDAF